MNYSNVYVTFSQQLIEVVGNNLTSNERVVFSFILNRTLRYNKKTERIPMRHFLNGVISSTGKSITAPVSGSKNTIKTVLKTLEEKGLISSKIGGDFAGSKYITVLVDKVKDFINMCALNVSKKFKEQQKNKDFNRVNNWYKGGQSEPNEGTKNDPTYKGSDIEGSDNKELEMLPSTDDTIHEIEQTVRRVRTQHADKRKKTLSTKEAFSKSSLRRVWDAACTEYALQHDEHPSRISSGSVGKLFTSSKNSPLYQSREWSTYIKDVISNWEHYVEHLIRDRNYTPANIPIIPDASYFLRHDKKAFLPYYYDRKNGNAKRTKMRDKNNTTAMKTKIARLEQTIEKLQSNAKSNNNTENDRIEVLQAKLRKAKKVTGYSNSLFD